MPNEPNPNPLPDSDSAIQRIEIEPEGPVDWSTALQELEKAEPGKAPAPPPVEEAPPAEESTQAARPSFIPRPPRKAPVIAEGTPAAEELSEILTSVNSALNQLRRFETAHKHVIAPNIFRVWEENLREAATVINREYRRLREENTETEPPQQDQAVGEES